MYNTPQIALGIWSWGIGFIGGGQVSGVDTRGFWDIAMA
ncbi:hypothetical protein SAMN05216529_11518 [Faecalicatena contorta]|uniref:Uncharacterized protein n=1 Tax=Faecalicatena contorta TaxID=39482 RepID=A0A315ZRI1_9FIRM|nr:hypothetical protein A8805_11518 [Faecalicatena contorta]SUQ15662.1 hypothetical protein SAMN05216529_11518 [Faecalicatena contorta]